MAAETFTIQSIERIEPEPRDADARWWRVAIDDGTIPAQVKVWATGSDAVRVPAESTELEDLVGVDLRAAVAEVRDVPAQVAALRALSPIQLHPEPIE